VSVNDKRASLFVKGVKQSKKSFIEFVFFCHEDEDDTDFSSKSTFYDG
jgi:hypothetical protein